MQQKEAFLAQKELEVKELRLQLVEKEQDLDTLRAKYIEIEMAAAATDHQQEMLAKNLEMFGILQAKLDKRKEALDAREKTMNAFRIHGKGDR